MTLLTKEKNNERITWQCWDYNNLKLEYIGLTRDISFYEYMDSKKNFNAIKNNQILSEVKNKQDNFFKKINEVKID